MPTNVPLYDASLTTVVVDSHILTNFQKNGAMFNVAWDNDQVSLGEDAQGKGGFSANAKNSGTVTINLDSQSPSNKVIADLCDRKATFAIDINDGMVHYSGAECMVAKYPDGEGGADTSNNAWQIKVVNLIRETIA